MEYCLGDFNDLSPKKTLALFYERREGVATSNAVTTIIGMKKTRGEKS
jgi:hypothetical protein